MAATFLSYRRSDTRADAGRLHDRLAAHFGDEFVFMDVDDIDAGENFVHVLQTTLARCKILLVLIGPRWLTANENGQRRLDDPDDFVRMEIEHALARKIPLIPVLVGGANMPQANELPASIAAMTHQQAYSINNGRFHSDVDRLLKLIETQAGVSFNLWRWFTRHRELALLAVAIAALLLWFAVLRPIQIKTATINAISNHLQISQRLVDDGRLALAIAEVKKAVELDSESIDAQRQHVKLLAEIILRKAFTDGRIALHIGLGPSFRRQRPVDSGNIDEAIGHVYRLYALAPHLEQDADVLLLHAKILKSSGRQIESALETLQRASTVAPARADILGEIGLIRAVVFNDRGALTHLLHALDMSPGNARLQFYAARGSHIQGTCAQASSPIDGKLCADALRAYRASIELTQQKTDWWSRHIRRAALYEMHKVVSAIATHENDILNPNLDMPNAERLAVIELLTQQTRPRSIHGWTDDPQYWLAHLHEALGNHEQAKAIISARITERKAQSPVWNALLERVSRL